MLTTFVAALAVGSPALTSPDTKPAGMAGTWVVTKDGKQNNAIKMIFDKGGNFRFVFSTASSRGKYHVLPEGLRLTWTEVDGQKVKPGSMQKTFRLAPDRSYFQIDTYRYERQGR